MLGGFDTLKIFGNIISGTGLTGGKGIQLFGHITGAEIYNNTLTGLYQGIKGFTYESTLYPEGNSIYHNQITGASNMLVLWEGTATFNVEENWWGSSTGPNPAMMSANVEYSPWCADAACTTLASDVIYVRTGGDDALCNGFVDADYSVGIAPYCAFKTIQYGINQVAANGTVNVAAGTYGERLVVDKPLTLSGAGDGLSTIDATWFGTAGNVIDITGLTGNTKIEGFDILTGDNSNGIHSSGGTDATGRIEILNNHIIGTYAVSDYQYGVIAGYGDVRTLVISGNEISNTYSNSILVELQMGASEITGNTLNGGYPSIFFMTYDGHDVTALQKVSGNTIDMSAAETGSDVPGIGVNPSTYYVELARRTGKYANFEISNNIITGLNDASFKGISIGENSTDGIAGGFDTLKIFGNTVSGTGLTGGKGIQLFGHITGAEIHNNTLTGLYQGIKGFTYESTFYPEGNSIYHNQITGASNMLVLWEGTATFNVEENWWGSSTGPNPAMMSSNVDYSPWCADAACTTLASVNLLDALGPAG